MVVRRGDLLVPLDRNPLEIFLLALCVVSGISNLVTLITTGATPDNPSPLVGGVFYVMLVAGGIGGIAGAYWKDALTGVLIVRAAMMPVAASSMSYALSIEHRTGNWLSAGIVAAFALTCAWRAWQITKHVWVENRRVIVRPADDSPEGGAQ